MIDFLESIKHFMMSIQWETYAKFNLIWALVSTILYAHARTHISEMEHMWSHNVSFDVYKHGQQ